LKKTVYKFIYDFYKTVWNFMDGLIKPSIINFLQTVSKKPSTNFVF
jgi:hypothetical protein